MKNPNGYGTVVKLSGNRRRPYAVRKTTGWNEKGHPIYLPVGYTATREEGLILLAQYNKSPWDIDAEKMTLAVLYETWKEKKAPTLKIGDGTKRSLASSFKHCSKYYDMKYKDMKSFHMQDCIDNCGCGYSTQWAIKNLFGHLDRFALEVDVIKKGYAVLTTAEPIPETKKQPFTDDEVKTMWKHQHEPWVDSVLVFLYTGFRLSELLGLEADKVDLEAGTLQGGVKTRAGKDRIVPIHPKVLPIIEKRVQEGNRYLFSHNGKKVSNAQYYIFWNAIMNNHSMKHTPHECRHTFRSLLDSAGANKKCIDMMMGHKSQDTGERIYTHKTLEELKEAIALISI